MLSVYFVILLFSVNLEFSSQNQTNLQTQMTLFEKNDDFILTEMTNILSEMININNDIENIWGKVNDTRKMLDIKFVEINRKYDQLKDEFESARKATHVSTVSRLQKHHGWVQHGTSIYKGFFKYASWRDAMKTCKLESYGVGLLAEIKDINESNFVAGLLLKNYYIWLGGCDLDKEGSWKWCGSNSSMTFTNWNVNEPNNSGGKQEPENCLMFYTKPSTAERKGVWNDFVCSSKLPFVCKMPLGL